MKLLFVLIPMLIPIAAFSQNSSANLLIGTGTKTGSEYLADPFRSYLLRADNPCKDKTLLPRGRDEVSGAGSETLNHPPVPCRKFLNDVEESRVRSQGMTNKESEDLKPNLSKYIYITGACAIVAGILTLLVD